MFAILVSALGVYQSVAVPNANEDVELAHSQEIQGDMVELRNAVRRSASAGTGDTVGLRLGVNYPPRTLGLNPSSGSGTFRTTGPAAVVVANAQSDAADVGDVWNGTNRTYTTRAVAFTPEYNYYREAGTTRIEGTVAYNDFGDDGAVPLSGQRLVDGREITLVTLEGDLATSQATSLAVDVEPVSVSRSTVGVRNTSDPINVTVPTRVPEEVWVTDLLAGQLDDPGATTCADTRTDDPTDDDTDGAYVAQCVYDDSTTPANLTLTLEPGTTYRFDVARVSVGPSDEPEPTPEYITVVSGDGQSVPEGGTREVVFEVRDEYDNPVPDAELDVGLSPITQGSVSVNGRENATLSDVTTNDDGELVVTYDAPGEISSSPVSVDIRTTLADGFDGYDESGPGNATADIRVINASKINRTTTAFNPEIGLVLESTTFESGTTNLDITFNNTGSEGREITGIRYAFFFGESQNNNRAISPYAVLQSPNRNLTLSGSTESVSIVVPPGANRTLEFDVEIRNRSQEEIEQGDYFVFSVLIDGERRETYFVAPTAE
ncbi:hypothetical protein [Halosegnis marinus]|uniref:hypothetical protein n=1 Tax=Halosegnis marinus TaxID=3034023 RepID=UPI003619178A